MVWCLYRYLVQDPSNSINTTVLTAQLSSYETVSLNAVPTPASAALLTLAFARKQTF
jgi:hypothetical protein